MEAKKFELISVRLEPELFEKVQERAEQNERSLNKEVIYILKDYFKQQIGARTGDTRS